MCRLYWVGVFTLVLGSVTGCAARGAYLSSGSTTLPPAAGLPAELFSEAPCQRCGAVVPCRCRVFSCRERLLGLLTCGSGCEDVYWGEWLSDPPEPCDHCSSQYYPAVTGSGIRVSATSGTDRSREDRIDSGEPSSATTSYSPTVQPLWKTSGWSGRR